MFGFIGATAPKRRIHVFVPTAAEPPPALPRYAAGRLRFATVPAPHTTDELYRDAAPSILKPRGVPVLRRV
ncbi:MAG: hypothetical protein SFX73_19775 [Kofleriaceae bacterium]|nr:hypothetical protein [Kofleriaceae bacterium]